MAFIEQNQLKIFVDDGVHTVHIRFVGTAANEDADVLSDFLNSIREDYSSRPSIILDFTELQFCYSACIKSLIGFCTEAWNRPPIRMHISKRITWQVTSLRAMAGISPQCVMVECDPSTRSSAESAVWNDTAIEESSSASACDPTTNTTADSTNSYCMHSETESREEHFFAPTGNGSIVTEIYCKSCGVVLSKTSEYFD